MKKHLIIHVRGSTKVVPSTDHRGSTREDLSTDLRGSMKDVLRIDLRVSTKDDHNMNIQGSKTSKMHIRGIFMRSKVTNRFKARSRCTTREERRRSGAHQFHGTDQMCTIAQNHLEKVLLITSPEKMSNAQSKTTMIQRKCLLVGFD
jgi:hypothetical protein